jgi:DNA-binding FrmR family transcriptional regulator
MGHTSRDKKKLLNRINRIRGQLNGIARALEEDRDCGEVLLTLASCRGAMNSLMAEILEGHIRLRSRVPRRLTRLKNSSRLSIAI